MLSVVIFAGLAAAPIHAASAGTYIVQPGDTMITIAARHGVSVSELAGANGLSWDSWVYVGQRLTIPSFQPGPSTVYVVQRDDTLSSIAHRFDTSIKNIMSTNHLLSTRIYVGQRLTIPGPQPEPSIVYVVEWGDTLSGIARDFGTTIQAIMSRNGLTSTRIYVGQRLTVPGCTAGGFGAP